eukprot:6213749-Pleurochrysis_carterae.AAC.6
MSTTRKTLKDGWVTITRAHACLGVVSLSMSAGAAGLEKSLSYAHRRRNVKDGFGSSNRPHVTPHPQIGQSGSTELINAWIADQIAGLSDEKALQYPADQAQSRPGSHFFYSTRRPRRTCCGGPCRYRSPNPLWLRALARVQQLRKRMAARMHPYDGTRFAGLSNVMPSQEF